jgi:hypothetical protein
MYGLEVRSRPYAPERKTRAELANMGAHLQWVWPGLPAPMTLEWSDSLVVALDQGTPWIYGPVERDPMRASSGSSVLPRQARNRLKKIATFGVPFQRLAIAHELDREGPIRHLIPALEAGPRSCPDEVARELVGGVPAHPLVARAVRVLDAAVGGAMFAAGLPASLVSSVLDPIIFGVIAPQPPRHGDLCLWYPLAAWRW